MDEKQEKKIVRKLLKYGEKPRDPKTGDYPYAGTEGNKAANRLVNDLEKSPHAFVIACVLDRQVPAEMAWSAPYKLKKRIGSFKFSKLRGLTKREWKKLLGPQKGGREVIHRYWKKVMPRCVHDAVRIIGEKYGGKASRIWLDQSPGKNVVVGKDVVARFKEIHGVGDKIGNMAVRILVTNHGVKMKTRSIDVSVDVHIEKVFCRLGLVKKSVSKSKMKKAIIDTARRLHPKFPGAIDPPAFHIGRDFCFKKNPNCGECPMNKVCNYALKHKPLKDTPPKRKQRRKWYC